MTDAAPLALRVEGLRKAFRVDGQVMLAVDEVSLEAREGEFVTLIGPSGCGKSTLLNLIAGLLEPDAGAIALHGIAGEPRLGRVGYMPQRDLLLPWRRVLDNILLAPRIMGRDLEAARREAMALLPLFGLDGFERAYPAALSGGMRQRAALMRTFIGGQDPLLLDEPFGALDALTRRTMRRWLIEVWDRFRQTILFVTHDVDEAVYLSDRVYVMSPRPGRVILELELDLPDDRRARRAGERRFAAYRGDILAALGLDEGEEGAA